MNRSTGGAGAAGGGPLARRLLLRAALTVGVLAGTAGALVPVLAARRSGVARERKATGAARQSLERFAETYRGRYIQGSATVMVPARGTRGPGDTETVQDAAAREARAAAVPSVEVRIDGRPLHVMRRADGTYLSLVNHYESFPTLRDVARAAVDELGDDQLSLTPMHSV